MTSHPLLQDIPISNSFWRELRERRVIRTLAAYGAVVFVVLQVADLVLPALTDSTWLYRALVVAALAGIPITTIVAWLYDRTDAGLVRAAPSGHLQRWRSRIAFMVLFIPFLVSIGWFAVKRVRAAGIDTDLVAVLPFKVTGAAPGLAFLQEGAVDLLGTKIAGINDGRVIDPQSSISAWRQAGGDKEMLSRQRMLELTRNLRAGRLLVGEVTGQEQSFVLTARLIDPVSGRTIVRARENGSVDQLANVFDRLAATLLSLQAGEDEARLQSLTTVSTAALREYLNGRSAYRQSRFRSAVDHFRAAIEHDTTFALAALGALQARGWSSVDNFPITILPRVRRIAASGRPSFSRLDRLILDAVVGPDFPLPASSVQRCGAWRSAAELQPKNAELLHWVGDCEYHEGPISAMPDFLSRARRSFERSVEADSSFAPSLQHLVEIAALQKDSAAAKRYGRLELQADTTAATRLVSSWLIAYTRNDTAALSRMMLAFDTYPRDALVRIRNFHYEEGEDVEYGAAAFKAMRDERDRFVATARYRLLMREGRFDDALKLARDSGSTQADAMDFEVALEGLYGEGDTLEAARSIAQLEKRLPTDTLPYRKTNTACMVGHWRAWRKQDLSSVRRVFAEVAAAPEQPVAKLAAKHCEIGLSAIESTLARKPDAHRRALQLDSVAAEGWRSVGGSDVTPLIAAGLLARVGDYKAAHTAIKRRPFALTVPPVLGTMLREEGRIAALAGDTAAAIQAYRLYLARRAGPDRYTKLVQTELQRLLEDRPR